MSSIPENHVTAEGRSLRAAVEAAAATLGVPYAQVEHKLDMAHFRSAQGAGIGADTVRIFAWAKDPKDLAPVVAAEDWMKGLLGAMDLTGQVRAERRGEGVVVHVDVGEAGRHLVGRGGGTLRAVQYLLEVIVGGKFPDTGFRIDVARADDREERRDEGGERDRRDDRGGDRGDRGGDRGERRDDRGGDRREARGRPEGRGGDRDRRGRGGDDRPPRRSEADIEDLKRLARKVAERVQSTGEAELIRRELNSFERRMVHTEIATMAGVGSRSVGEGHDRRIEIYVPTGEDAPQDE
jgi:predicted RNA-binding protein Jag